MTNVGVHQAHCCKEHGCKYAFNVSQNENCPVIAELVVQEFPCERCDEEIEKTKWIDPLVRGFFNMKDPVDCKLANALIDALVTKVKEVL